LVPAIGHAGRFICTVRRSALKNTVIDCAEVIGQRAAMWRGFWLARPIRRAAPERAIVALEEGLVRGVV